MTTSAAVHCFGCGTNLPTGTNRRLLRSYASKHVLINKDVLFDDGTREPVRCKRLLEDDDIQNLMNPTKIPCTIWKPMAHGFLINRSMFSMERNHAATTSHYPSSWQTWRKPWCRGTQVQTVVDRTLKDCQGTLLPFVLIWNSYLISFFTAGKWEGCFLRWNYEHSQYSWGDWHR